MWSREPSCKGPIYYSRAPCLGAEQKTRGLWERDWILPILFNSVFIYGACPKWLLPEHPRPQCYSFRMSLTSPFRRPRDQKKRRLWGRECSQSLSIPVAGQRDRRLWGREWFGCFYRSTGWELKLLSTWEFYHDLTHRRLSKLPTTACWFQKNVGKGSNLAIRGRPFNSWGGWGGAWFWKKKIL